MRSFLIKLIAVLVAFTFGFAPVQAQGPTVESLQEQIASLLSQIEALQAKINSQSQEITGLQSEVAALRIKSELRIGSNGEDVKTLQEILASDPSIYPEGLVTGFFGPLTASAVKRFQQKFEIEQVGVVGPKTLEKINQILEVGAGKSGVVPPGLLIAPGLRAKLEIKDGKIKYEVKPDNSGPGSANSGRDDDEDEDDDESDDDEEEEEEDEEDEEEDEEDDDEDNN